MEKCLSSNNDGDKLDKDGNDRRSYSIVPKEFINAKPIWESSNCSGMFQLDDTDDFPNVGSVSCTNSHVRLLFSIACISVGSGGNEIGL